MVLETLLLPFCSERILERLFKDGRLDELQKCLRQRVNHDDSDIRSVYRLANLHAYQDKLAEALLLYDIAWGHRWPGPVCLNNIGVVLIRQGQTRPGIKALYEVNQMEGAPAAASFNLGILIETVFAFSGSYPPIFGQMEFVEPDKKPAEAAAEYFRTACERPWLEGTRLDGALYLWPNDILPNIGFEATVSRSSIEAAHEHLNEALSRLQEGDWRMALDLLAQAASLAPILETHTNQHRITALLGLCRELREQAVTLRRAGDYRGARNILQELVSLFPELPDRELVTEILVTEINNLAERLRMSSLTEQLPDLQKLITAAGTHLDDLREVWQEGVDVSRGHGNTETSSSQHNRDPISVQRYLAQVCTNAWDRQIRLLVRDAQYDRAIDLATYGEMQWFSQGAEQRWRAEVLVGKALDAYACAREALEEGKRGVAEQHLREARTSALEADAQSLVRQFDAELSRLISAVTPAEDIETLRVLLDRRNYTEVLGRCQRLLKRYPTDGNLSSIQKTALNLLLEEAHAAERLKRWDIVSERLKLYWRYCKDDEAAQAMLGKSTAGIIDQLAEDAWFAWQAGEHTQAARLCNEALEQNPKHQKAGRLKAIIEVNETINWNELASAYRKIYQDCMRAIAEKNPAEAFKQARELRRLEPDEALTEEACTAAFSLYISDFRYQLESSRNPEHAKELAKKVEQLLDITPDFKPAIELMNELNRTQLNRKREFAQKARKKLEEARQALYEGVPEKALTFVREALERNIPTLRSESEDCCREALAMLQQRLKSLTKANQYQETDETTRLIKIIAEWCPHEAAQIEVEFDQRRRTIEAEFHEKRRMQEGQRDVPSEIGEIIDRVRHSSKGSLRILYNLNTDIRRFIRRRPGTPKPQVNRLLQCREELLQSMLPPQKLAAGLVNWMTANAVPYKKQDKS